MKLKTNKTKFFCTQHAIILWNSLPQEIIKIKNLARFNKGLDINLDNKNIQSH